MGPYFQNLIFYGMSERARIPSGRTNIFRSSIFNLFPNLVEVELEVDKRCRLNLLSLLSVLNDSVIPSSFKVIKIREKEIEYGDDTRAFHGASRKWLIDHFKSIPNVKEQFAAKNWVIKHDSLEEDKGRVLDWIFIKKQQ